MTRETWFTSNNFLNIAKKIDVLHFLPTKCLQYGSPTRFLAVNEMGQMDSVARFSLAYLFRGPDYGLKMLSNTISN
jgi:hypothetical protein